MIEPKPLGGNVYEVLDMVEKPAPKDAPSDLAIIGRYVLTPDLFPILAETPPDARGEIQLTNGLRTLQQRRPIYAVEFEGHRYDTGDKLGFLKATVAFALARPDLATTFAPTSRAWALGDEECLDDAEFALNSPAASFDFPRAF